MPSAHFRVVTTASAEGDLREIVDWWHERGEPWRGDQYFAELSAFAIRELGNAGRARLGRCLKSRRHPEARSLLAFGIYRVIYEIDEALAIVSVLRFWHAHRDAPPLS